MELRRRPDPNQLALTFLLAGDVEQDDFVPWMERQASRLGVVFTVVQHSTDAITLRAVGAPEMTQAFALACSLGPKSVLIEHLRILEGGDDL